MDSRVRWGEGDRIGVKSDKDVNGTEKGQGGKRKGTRRERQQDEEVDTKDRTGKCSRDRERGRSNRLVEEDSRRRGRVRGGKKAVMRNRDGRASKECFLKAEDHG